MWRENHWHIPEKYRGPQSFSWGFLRLYLVMPVFMIIAFAIAPFFDGQIDFRMFYSEIYMVNATTTKDGESILIECCYGEFVPKGNTTFNISYDKNYQFIDLRTEESPYAKSKFLITIPLDENVTHIALKQENGFKQLILEKDKETLQWKPATEVSRFLFFAKHHTIICVVLCTTLLVTIVGIVILVRVVSKKMRKEKYKDKDPFTDEL